MKHLFLSLFILLPMAANAAQVEAEIDGIRYRLASYYVNDYSTQMTHTASVVRKSETSAVIEYKGNVVIPEKVNYEGVNYTVERIDSKAFLACYELTSVSIPNTVTSIGAAAFDACVGLYSIVIPNSVVEIQYGAFLDCYNLKSVTIGNSLAKIGYSAFGRCEKLQYVYCYANPQNLEWDDSEDNINFQPDKGTLFYVTNKSDWEKAFPNVNVTFKEDQDVLPLEIDGIYYHLDNNTKTAEVSKNLFKYTGNIVIPASVQYKGVTYSVKSIGESAFQYCRGLTGVTLPSSVTTIKGWAFSDCSGLTSITIPKSVTKIKYCAFSSCKNMDHVYCYADPKSLNWGDYDDQYYFKPDKGTLFHVYNKGEWEETFPNANVTFVEDLSMEGDSNSEDVTHYLQNAGFDEDLTWQADGSKKDIVDQSITLSNRSLAGIAADSTVYALVNPSTPKKRSDGRTLEATNGFIGRMQGWTVETNVTFPKCEWVYFGTIPYDLAPHAIPIGDDGSTYLEVPERPEAYSGDDNVGFAYLSAGWGNRAVYKQVVKLPCAVYRLEYWAINKNPTGMKCKNLSKVVCLNDTWKDETGFSDTEWTRHTIKFTPTSEFTIEFGFESSASGGSGSNPFLCIDGIKLSKIGEAGSFDLLRSDFQDAVAECKELAKQANSENFTGLASYLSNYAMEIDDISQNADQAVLKASLTVINARMAEIRKSVAAMDDVNATLSRMDNLLKTTNFAGKAILETVYKKILGYKVNDITEDTDVVAQLLGAKAEGDKAIEAYNRSQMVTLTFEATGEGCEGIAPAAQKVEIGTMVKIPANTTLFCKGKTLNAWTDGANQYTVGQELTVNADITLTPVFTDNTVTLADRTAETVLVWQFGVGNGTGTLNAQGKSTILVTQATINGATIDVKMDIDATKGKISNIYNSDKWAQCNDGTIFTIPAYKGTAVAIDSYGDANGTTIGGIEATNKAVTYKGTAETIDIVAKGISYIASVTAVYPVPGQSIEDEIDELTLELSPNHIEEGTKEQVKLKLARSGSWESAETVLLKATEDSRVIVPATIIIPARQSAAVAYLSITNNDVVDNDSVIEITAMSDKYKAVTARLVIEDDDFPQLTVKASKSVVNEGETFQLIISTTRASSTPIEVTLNSENDKRFTYPRKKTIPAGQTSVTVDVTVKDDDIPSEALSNTFTASAYRFNQGETIVLLEDDDMPVLQLTLQPNKVQEGAGPVSVAGTLRRTGVTTNKITVRLSDDSNGGLYFGTRELVLNKGVEEISFNFGPIDNALVDGDRTYTVTAAVWLSSCSCSAAGETAGSVSAQLQVLDDDGPALALSSTTSTIKEGGKATLTVSRNTTTSLEQPLTIYLSSDYDENLSYEHTVTIPVGQQTAQVEITSTKNDVSDDSHTVVFTVQADGFASGTCWLMVTDQTLPDAVITDFSVAESEVEIGETTTVSITIKNYGSAVLPARTQTHIYMVDNNGVLLTFYTQDDLAPDETVTISKPLTFTVTPGKKKLYAVVNEARGVPELNYTNNTSDFTAVLLKSPYYATVTTDQKVYNVGDTIHFIGSVEGSKRNNTEVEVYFIENGNRQFLLATTDSNGNFECNYTPFKKQVGHFAFGACYPGEHEMAEQGTFDVIGLLRTSTDYIICEMTVGTPYQGQISIKNPTAIDQHNVHIEIIEGYENITVTVAPITTLAANSIYDIAYTVEGSSATKQQVWQQVVIRLTSDEGAATDIILYCFCRQPEAQLALDIDELNTTITKGTTREYPIVLTNQGAGETGVISLSLPNHLQASTATELPSLQSGDSLTIALKLSVANDMQIGVPITGKIGINCENGNGIALPYCLLPVSTSTGTLVVDVCDEYTYYSEDEPHLAGATVVVSSPFSGEHLAEGITENDGKFQVELPEGYYQLDVTADGHDPWRNNIIVNPERVTTKIVNLFHDVIKVEWVVEETEVEDEYNIKTTVIYETNVPAPVVVTELPDSLMIDDMAPGESVLIYATLTNKGLIAAEDVQLLFPKEDYLTFEPLVDMPFKLIPHQSVSVPIRVTLSPDVEIKDDDAPASSRVSVSKEKRYVVRCYWNVITAYFWKCGDDHKIKRYEKIIYSGYHCDKFLREYGDSIIHRIPNPNGDGFIWMGGGGGGSSSTNKTDECLTCKEALYEALTEGFWESLEGLKCVPGTLICSGRKLISNNDGDVEKEILDCEKNGLKCMALKPLTQTLEALCMDTGLAAIPCALGVAALNYVVGILISPFKCFGFGIRVEENARLINGRSNIEEEYKPVLPSYAIAMKERSEALANEITAFLGFNEEIFGDSVWLECCPTELTDLLDAIMESEKALVADNLRPLKPDNIDNARFDLYINRINNTFFGESNPTGGRINREKLKEYSQTVYQLEQQAVAAGFESVFDWWEDEFPRFRKNLTSDVSNSVCASVTLQIEQTMTLTRPAYRGTLTVFNGHEDTPMENVRLNLVVKDEAGRIASEREFQMNAESLDGFGGEVSLTSNWTLEAQKTGKATVLFIPTKYAAPSEPVKYSFGGTLTYIDPFTGLEVTRDIFPVTMTVNPLPDLELTYLMQRDIYGDDPLTEDVAEPMEPAEFALIINNKGNGEAKNVKMLTEQPKIIENEKDLLVNFEIVSSQMNGAPASLSFGQTIANDFGTIVPHSQSYAQWWLQSSLLGHFTSYEVAATHVTDYGNVHLSLIDTVTIHEMIHGFTPLTSPKRGFLVNDIVDADDLPDVVYFTDATQQPLYMAAGSISRLSNSEFMLTTTTKQPGWNYGSVADPTGGRLRLAQITRSSDGTILPLDNMWQTSRTLRDARDWLNENRLHFVALLPEGGESYMLTFKTQEEVGVKAVTDSDGLHVKLSPIPIGEWMYISGNFREARRVEFYDMRGIKRLNVANMVPGKGVYMGSLRAGLYYVTVTTDRGVFRTKVLKR